MEKQNKIVIVLGIIIFLLVEILVLNWVNERAYQQGVEDASLFINQQMISSLGQNGYVPFSFTQDGQIYQLKLGIMKET
jgi:hypothetical protein